MFNGPIAQLLWFLALAMVISAEGCGTRPETAARHVVVWEPRGSWSGHGSMQTESFIGSTGMFRFRWDARSPAAPSAGALKVTLHSAVSGRPLVVAFEHEGTGRDVTYVSEDPRLFYLVVESSDLEWSVAVDEGVAATAEGALNR